jgi:hypothetical protein
LSQPGKACDVLCRLVLALVAAPRCVNDEAKLKTQ